MDTIKISKNGITVSFNIHEMQYAMTTEQRQALAKDLCWDEIMQEALERLAGTSDCYNGNDGNAAFEFLRDQIVDQALNIKFGAFDRVRGKIQGHLFDSRLYWSLLHNRNTLPNSDVEIGEWFRQWSRVNGFEDSNYCDKSSGELADAVVAKFEELLKEEVNNG